MTESDLPERPEPDADDHGDDDEARREQLAQEGRLKQTEEEEAD